MYRHREDSDGKGCANDDLQILYEIAQLLASGIPQREMLAELLNKLEKQLGLVRGTVMLLLPDDIELIVEAARTREHTIRQVARYQKGEGIIGRVVETGAPIIVPDIQEEPQFQNRIHRRTGNDERRAAFVCVPVTLEREVVGALSADIPHQSAVTPAQAQHILSIIASMIAAILRTERRVRQERNRLQKENDRLRRDLGEQFRPANIIGASHVMRTVYERIKILSDSDTTVMVRGSSGTGKELIASAIHYSGKRKDKPLIKVNCAALSEGLIESELFGHEKGAFSGALYTRKGRIEEAEGGTLFLDEIGEFSPALQVKLLRVLQEKQYERVGSNRTLTANVRLIAATNRDLEKAVADGAFREDLYYRINVFPVILPQLQDRKEDILPLANYFVDTFAAKMGKKVTRISTPAIDMLMAYHWPGNVRELENCIEYAVLLTNDGVIYAHSLPPTLQTPDDTAGGAAGGLRVRIQSFERDMIVDALKRTGGNVTAAARALEITPRMLRYKIKQLGLRTQSF